MTRTREPITVPTPPRDERTLLEWELPALPEAVAQLRRDVRAVLGESGDVVLCVSELVTNVITHVGAGTPVSLRLTAEADGCTRVELTDPVPHVWPVLRRATDEEECGRGIALLDAVARRWGVRQEADGKTVWCEID